MLRHKARTAAVFYSRRAPRVADRTRARRTRSAVRFGVLTTVAIAGLYGLAVNREGFSVQHLLASLIIALSAYPYWRYIRRDERTVPFVPLLCLVHGLYYGLQPLLPFEGAYWASEESVVRAQLLVLGGLSALMLTFYILGRHAWSGLLPSFSLDWSEHKARRLGLVLGAVGLAVNMSMRALPLAGVGNFIPPLALGGLITFLGELSIVAIAILFLLQLRGRLPRMHKVVLWGFLVPVYLLVDISSASVFQIVRLVVLLAMLRVTVRRALPWRLILPVLPIFVVFAATKHEYRALLRSTDAAGASNPLRGGLTFVDVAVSFVANADGERLWSGLEAVAGRTDGFRTLGYVVDQTPDPVPYWRGKTYAALPWKLVPRFLIPEKPGDQLGLGFGHRYAILAPEDSQTSINLPQIVEMYANFGALGVIVGMCLLGVLYRAMYHSFNHDRVGEWGRVSIAVLSSQLVVTIESNFSLVYGGILHWIIMFYLLGLSVRRPARARSPGVVLVPYARS